MSFLDELFSTLDKTEGATVKVVKLAESCSNPRCKEHGDGNPAEGAAFTPGEMEDFTAEDALKASLAAAATAYNALLRGRLTEANLLQKQANLWMELRETLAELEEEAAIKKEREAERAERDASSGKTEQPVG